MRRCALGGICVTTTGREPWRFEESRDAHARHACSASPALGSVSRRQQVSAPGAAADVCKGTMPADVRWPPWIPGELCCTGSRRTRKPWADASMLPLSGSSEERSPFCSMQSWPVVRCGLRAQDPLCWSGQGAGCRGSGSAVELRSRAAPSGEGGHIGCNRGSVIVLRFDLQRSGVQLEGSCSLPSGSKGLRACPSADSWRKSF